MTDGKKNLAVTISAVIPTLNDNQKLSLCLEKLRGQVFEGELEIIIVDGGSKDNVKDIAFRYGCKLIIVKGSNPYEALSIGVRLSTGEFLWKIDSDNYILDNDGLEKLYEPFIHDSQLNITFPQVVISPSMSSFARWLTNLEINNLANALAANFTEISDNFYTNDLLVGIHNASLIRLKAIEQIGGITNDFIMLKKMRELNIAKAAYVPAVKYIHDQKITPLIYIKKWRNRLKTYNKEGWFAKQDSALESDESNFNKYDNLFHPIRTMFFSIKKFISTGDSSWLWGIINVLLISIIILGNVELIRHVIKDKIKGAI